MTSTTAGYHSSDSKWHLAPDFTITSLPEDSTIENAIQIVLKAKNKNLSTIEKQLLISHICNISGGDTINDLYNLSENQWNIINQNIPKICGIYLRHLLVQSFKYKSKLQLLEHDFNWGLTINWSDSIIKSKIDQLLSIGFNFDDAAEAIIVTNYNNNKPIDVAIDYLLLDENSKRGKYEKERSKLNRIKIRRLSDNDYTQYESLCGYNTFDDQKEYEIILINKWKQTLIKSQDNKPLINEINSHKQKLFQLKQKKLQYENKLNEYKLELYTHFVSGILSNNKLNISQITQWKKYRKNNNISENEHILILNKFGYKSDDDLDKIKTYINTSNLTVSNELIRYDSNGSAHSIPESTTQCTWDTTTGNKKECVICYSDISLTNDIIYMLCPCYHICLCKECALKYYNTPHNDQKCPICCTVVTDIKQVFFA
eukprot:334077_1